MKPTLGLMMTMWRVESDLNKMPVAHRGSLVYEGGWLPVIEDVISLASFPHRVPVGKPHDGCKR